MAQTSTEWLEANYPQYKPVSKAPSFGNLQDWAEQRGITIQRVMQSEAQKWYGAAEKSGDGFKAFMVRNNSALMAWDLECGRTPKFQKAQPINDGAAIVGKKRGGLFNSEAA